MLECLWTLCICNNDNFKLEDRSRRDLFLTTLRSNQAEPPIFELSSLSLALTTMTSTLLALRALTSTQSLPLTSTRLFARNAQTTLVTPTTPSTMRALESSMKSLLLITKSGSPTSALNARLSAAVPLGKHSSLVISRSTC